MTLLLAAVPEAVFQLAALLLIVVAGPVIVGLVALRGGRL